MPIISNTCSLYKSLSPYVNDDEISVLVKFLFGNDKLTCVEYGYIGDVESIVKVHHGLFGSASSGNIVTFNKLLTMGVLNAETADLDNRKSYIGAAMDIASRDGHIDIVKSCINVQCFLPTDFMSPIEHASLSGHLDTLKLLIRFVKIEECDFKHTMLYAIMEGHVHVIEYLQTFSEPTDFHLIGAIIFSSLDIVKLLFDLYPNNFSLPKAAFVSTLHKKIEVYGLVKEISDESDYELLEAIKSLGEICIVDKEDDDDTYYERIGQMLSSSVNTGLLDEKQLESANHFRKNVIRESLKCEFKKVLYINDYVKYSRDVFEKIYSKRSQIIKDNVMINTGDDEYYSDYDSDNEDDFPIIDGVYERYGHEYFSKEEEMVKSPHVIT